jgi:hypothetical protein
LPCLRDWGRCGSDEQEGLRRWELDILYVKSVIVETGASADRSSSSWRSMMVSNAEDVFVSGLDPERGFPALYFVPTGKA